MGNLISIDYGYYIYMPMNRERVLGVAYLLKVY